ADIAENSPVLFRVPEPVRPAASAARRTAVLKDLVWGNVDRLDDLADRSLPNKLAGIHSRSDFQSFAIHDAVDPLRLSDRLTHIGQLLQRGDPGLVREKILALFHSSHPKRRALI